MAPDFEASANLAGIDPAPAKDGEALAISQLAHKTLKAVQGDYDKLSFNKAVARIYELVNALAAPLGRVAAGEGMPPIALPSATPRRS